jgi:hypothetical protein
MAESLLEVGLTVLGLLQLLGCAGQLSLQLRQLFPSRSCFRLQPTAAVQQVRILRLQLPQLLFRLRVFSLCTNVFL